MTPRSCVTCRYDYKKNGRQPPCDITGVCGITGYSINGDENSKFAMEIDEKTKIAADIWYEITSISPRKKYVIFEKKKEIIKWLPTLQMFNAYFKAISINHLGIDVDELKYLIFAFHRVYVGILCQS